VRVKEIDEFFRDYLRPPLKAAGFRRKGRLFYLGSSLDDVAVIETRSFPVSYDTLCFWMKAALYPEPYRAFQDLSDTPTNASWGLWSRQIGPASYGDPDAPDTDTSFWNVPKSDKEAWGAFLGRFLSDHLVPFLKQMRDRPSLIRAIKAGELQLGSDALTVLAEEGPSPELAAAVARCQRVPEPEYRQKVDDFLRSRIPPLSPAQQEEFGAMVSAARRAMPIRSSGPIVAVARLADGVAVELAGRLPISGRTAYHGRLVDPDGREIPCLVGPDSVVQIDGDYRGMVRVGGIPADQVAIGSSLRVSQYRADEDDLACWT